MAARAKYPPPHVQLRDLAVKARLAGKTFEQWWREALPVKTCAVCSTETLLAECPECGAKTRGPSPPTVSMSAPPEGVVLWPTDAVDRRMWLAAVDESHDGWRSAYERTPPSASEAALPYLMRVLGEEDDADDAPQRGHAKQRMGSGSALG